MRHSLHGFPPGSTLRAPGTYFFLLKFLEYSILKFGTYRLARFWNIPFFMEYPRIFQILFGTYIVWENLEYDNLFGIFRKNIRDIPVVKKMEYGIFRYIPKFIWDILNCPQFGILE